MRAGTTASLDYILVKRFWIQKTLSMRREGNGKPPVVVMEADFTRGAEKQLFKGFQKHKKQN